jgi:hypothetical protein
MLQQVSMDRTMIEAKPEGRWFQLIEITATTPAS